VCSALALRALKWVYSATRHTDNRSRAFCVGAEIAQGERMSNIAGKAYAMSLVTPIRRLLAPVNRLLFWAVGTPFLQFSLRGLQTLSMIHYARWVIVRDRDFPRLSDEQPRERLRYAYMFFFSNFNGSWEQYVDSFAVAIPSGLNLLWFKNVGWPNAVPEQPFHRYVEFNQIWTDYYYSAYPMAASNDVKAAQRVKQKLTTLAENTAQLDAPAFMVAYNQMLKELQGDLSQMSASPLVSLAAEAISSRRRGVSAVEGRARNDREVAKLLNNTKLPVENSNDVAIEERTHAE
jgi:hypothetical protein